MKLVWKQGGAKKRSRPKPLAPNPSLPFESVEEASDASNLGRSEPESIDSIDPDLDRLVESLRSQGNQLAEDGRYHEALGKWEAALNLMPDSAVLHEQKAQVLLELGDAWNALRASTRATQLKPSWPEAWVTLGRAQLNYGEPDSSIESFDKALEIKPDYEEAKVDREAAVHLVKKRKRLHLSGLSDKERRFRVVDKAEGSEP
ncbi:tetratricopeptide repeat protein 33 [Ananas comosus]|uniref:Tetratricopeptide repeat protein 33 n=1 Tax=Ananas comosus TaxID=4615 RepID=A0A199UJ71_ANACO|nr:tetratricopeptide repeat protein 33 [Ananas comosus]OAY64751.1 Tetratricopeptide repeat protein 33 [Ananas comosus]